MRYSVGLDLDGCLADIYPTAIKILKEMYPEKGKKSTNSLLFDSYGLTEQEMLNCFIEVGRKGLLRTLPLYPGAKEALYKINRKYNIFFVSWRNYIPNAREDTLYWLDSNKLPYERLILTNNKLKIAQKEKFCFFLDDNVDQCNRICKSMVPTYLFRRPWNRPEDTDSMCHIISSWKDVSRLLDGQRY